MGFAYAHHFAPDGARAALLRYRKEFRPSSSFRSKPHAIVAVAAVCGDTDAHADDLAGSSDLSWIRFGQGQRDLPLPSLEEVRAYRYDDEEEQLRRLNRSRVIIGGVEKVSAVLRALVTESRADEVMATVTVHDHEERKRVYDRLAAAMRSG